MRVTLREGRDAAARDLAPRSSGCLLTGPLSVGHHNQAPCGGQQAAAVVFGVGGPVTPPPGPAGGERGRRPCLRGRQGELRVEQGGLGEASGAVALRVAAGAARGPALPSVRRGHGAVQSVGANVGRTGCVHGGVQQVCRGLSRRLPARVAGRSALAWRNARLARRMRTRTAV